MAESTLTPEQTQALLQSIIGEGKTPPAKLGDLELVRDPTTNEPIAYRDPNTGTTIQIPRAAQPKTQPTQPTQWTTVYRIPGDVNSGAVAQWDPVNNEYHPLPNAGAQPTGQFTPVYRTPDKPDSGIVALVDTGDKSFHPVAGEAAAKPSGQYSNVLDPRDPTGKRVIGMVDTGNHEFHALAQDPATQKNLIQTPTAVFSVDSDNKVTKLVDIDKSSPYQAVVIDGKPYQFNPNEKDPNKAFSLAPGDWSHPPLKDGNGLTQTWDEAQGKYVYPPGVSPAATMSANTQAPNFIWYDQNGKEVARQPNPNYQPRQPNLPAPNLNAPNILVEDPDKPGQLKWIPNQGRVTASEALKNLASTLSGQVVSGDISVDEAKTIIDAANNRMTAEGNAAQTATTAAGHILTATQGAAQTGAGLLNQRVQAATGALTNIVGQAAGSKMLNAPAGLGAGLVQGLTDWTTQLGGGQGVYDTAAQMVKDAHPDIGGNPTLAGQAYTALRGMMDLYKQQTGKDYRPGTTTGATAAPPAAGFSAPMTTAPPTPPPVPPPTQPVMASQQLPINQAVMPGYINPWLRSGVVAPGFGGSAGFIAPIMGAV